ncbi:hypothetical protein NQ318_020591 [Aromia moschata]|uniref:Peptidoglycan recognition protein family domain-containing protein n=1 Tax=Aromia moschata TaxID=1265417 RepID=A0AAV8Z2H2_9CUCU|nr:hypothetical protein NQ318_020591 [Aromia moschata]
MTEWRETGEQNRTENSVNNDSHAIEVQESTPLLIIAEHRRHWLEKVFLGCLVLVLVVGVTVAAYLLCVEDESDVPEKFFLVLREDWGAQPNMTNVPRLVVPTQRVLLLQTNTSGCWDLSECFEKLRYLQMKHKEEFDEPDILYNFVVGGDGRVYEGRGGITSRRYYDDNPQVGQYDELEAFFDYSVMRNNLAPCYEILVRDQSPWYLLDWAYEIREKVRRENDC